MQLARPLSASQIRAAQSLHRRLRLWLETDSALQELGRRFPDFDTSSTLLKVTTINALYGTNVYAVNRMAAHIQGVLAEAELELAPWELVERIAALPMEPGERPRRFLSFASKFAHFFLDANLYPIKDRFADAMLRFHLGRRNVDGDGQHPYRAYTADFKRLRELSGFTGTIRELDRYLWLAGQYRAWKKNHKAVRSREVTELFENPTPETAAELDALLPSILDKAFKGEL